MEVYIYVRYSAQFYGLQEDARDQQLAALIASVFCHLFPLTSPLSPPPTFVPLHLLSHKVTQRLLETESKRLEEAGVDVAGGKKGGVKTLAQRRLRTQYEQLNKEYENAGRELLKGKTVRSHPTLGLKSMGAKKRSSIFVRLLFSPIAMQGS